MNLKISSDKLIPRQISNWVWDGSTILTYSTNVYNNNDTGCIDSVAAAAALARQNAYNTNKGKCQNASGGPIYAYWCSSYYADGKACTFNASGYQFTGAMKSVTGCTLGGSDYVYIYYQCCLN